MNAQLLRSFYQKRQSLNHSLTKKGYRFFLNYYINQRIVFRTKRRNIFLNRVIKGVVTAAKEEGITVITPEFMNKVQDKRSSEK